MSGMKRLDLPVVARKMEKMPLKYAAIVSIGVPTGCRVTEIVPLRRRDLIDDEHFRELIRFDKLKDKSGIKHRILTVPQFFRQTLIRHLNKEADCGYCHPDDWVFRGVEGNHLSRFSVYNFFRSILGSGYGTHWMRKTFAWEVYNYYLRQNPEDFLRALELTRQALGHKRIETTIKYLGIVEERLYETQNAIFNNIKGITDATTG